MDNKLQDLLIGFFEDVKEKTSTLEDELVYHNGAGELIYVTDIETSEILYMNKGMKQIFGDQVGKKCFDGLQNLHENCSFCTNEIIINDINKPYQWFFYNKTVDKTFFIIDTCKEYKGKLLRVEKAYEISNNSLDKLDEIKQQVNG